MNKQKLFIVLLAVFTSLCAFAQNGWNISLLDNWKDNNLPPSAAHDNTYNEVWGFTQNSKEYAVIGSTMGTHIIDVSNPLNVSEIDFIPGAVADSTVVHRDFHDYKGYLYMVCDEGNSSLQIADLSYLPDSVHLVYDSDSLLVQSHNIFIDSTTAKLYSCNTDHLNNKHSGLAIFSLTNPAQPQTLDTFNLVGDYHDIYVKNDTAFGNVGHNGLYIIDFSNPNNPQFINSLTLYPDQDYNHSGWISQDGNTYFFADEKHGMDLKALNISNYSNLQVLSLFNSGEDSLSIAHNPIVKGNHLYVSYYHDGLRIFNVSDPSNPSQTGFYKTSSEPHATDYKGAWGVYPFLPSGNILVSDMQNGLFVLNAENATGIQQQPDHAHHPNMKISPNPFSEKVEVLLPGHHHAKNIAVFDLTGKIVHLQKTHKEKRIRLNLEALQPGVYIIRSESNKGFVRKKIVKSR